MFYRAMLAVLVVAASFYSQANQPDVEKALPKLHQAVINGDLSAVKKLIEAGADVNQLDARMGNAPAHIAAQTDHTEILRYLLDNGAFINLQTPRSGFTPLMVAAWYSKADNLQALFEYPELNIELANSRGVKAKDMVGGWDRNVQPHEARLYAQLRSLFDVQHQKLRQQLAQQNILNVIDQSNLSEADKVARIKQLLAAGEDVNQRRPVYSNRNDWHTPLLVAAREGYTDIVALLLNNGADQTIPGYPMDAIAFHKAGYMGHPEIVKLLLNDKNAAKVINAQGPNNGYTPLHDAIWHGNTEAAKVFIKGGAVQNLKTYEQDTPKQLAERYGYKDILKLLD